MMSLYHNDDGVVMVTRVMMMFVVQSGGAEGFILDLRNNPGGLVRAGLDIARLWLDGNAAIFNVQGREDNSHMAIMQVGAPFSAI